MLVYASELAAAIGRNKYKQPWTVFENMWRRVNEQQYQECVEAQGMAKCTHVTRVLEQATAAIATATEQVDATTTTATVETLAAEAVAVVQQLVQVQLEQVWQGEKKEMVKQLEACKTENDVKQVLQSHVKVQAEQVKRVAALQAMEVKQAAAICVAAEQTAAHAASQQKAATEAARVAIQQAEAARVTAKQAEAAEAAHVAAEQTVAAEAARVATQQAEAAHVAAQQAAAICVAAEQTAAHVAFRQKAAAEAARVATQQAEAARVTARQAEEAAEAARVKATVQLVQKRAELKSKAVSEVQCTFGTVRESQSRDQVQLSGQARDIRHDNKFHVAWIQEPLPVSRQRWGVGGRLDGLDADGRVVEIKNRARHFFAKIPDYEYVQVQAYMHMINAEATVFVQQLDGQQRICVIKRCTTEWNDVIVPAITSFVELLDLFVDDDSYLLRAEWVNSTDLGKQRLLERWLQEEDQEN